MKSFGRWIGFFVIAFLLFAGYWLIARHLEENKILRKMIERLEADSRVAQILVTGVNFDEKYQKTFTTIKFLEFNSRGKPLEAKYFTLAGNIIQFQSLIIRFDDMKVRNADKLRGKSAYLFMKAFMLDGANTQVFEITRVNEIPSGYKIEGVDSPFERKLWQAFWKYVLDPQAAKKMGIKNAQIEAPGTVFIPGTLYTIKIEHDGGLRIDAEPLPAILKGEKIE